MKILVTGANGFIGKNLCLELKNRGYGDIFKYDLDTPSDLLLEYSRQCGFVFHLAGVNRPKSDNEAESEAELIEGNFNFTSTLLQALKQNNNKAPVLISSSIHVDTNPNSPYSLSKKKAEDLLFSYGKEQDVKVFVYRLPNVFGKWCRPNYNSAVATFCHNMAHDIPITVNNPATSLKLVYIDDVVNEFISALEGKAVMDGEFCSIPIVHEETLGEIIRLLESFKESRRNLSIPELSNPFIKKLYATYLSCLPTGKFNYPLRTNKDDRGSFSEVLKTQDRGQIAVNVIKPGIEKGNHFHNTKCEKFLVVSGKGLIQFRKPDEDEIYEYFVSEEKLEVIDIPPGYTHSIKNLGETNLVTIIWASEVFDPEKPDTIMLRVKE